MSGPPLSGLNVGSINNIYIFLADVLRYDEIPDEIAKRGVYFKTVAHALTTPQCLPTISSGRFAPKTRSDLVQLYNSRGPPHAL